MLANRLQKVKPSPTLVIANEASAMKASGIDVINLSVGEPDFDTPDFVKEAGIQAIKSGKTKYTPVQGIKELKDAVISKLKKENDLTYTPKQIVVGNGAKQIIFNAFLATLNAGDEVIIPSPYWVSYPDMVLVADGVPKVINCGIQDNFKLTPEKLEAAITPKTKWLIINSPSNPTGAIYTESELRNLAKILLKYPNIYIMSDDIYEHIIFDGEKFFTIAQVEPKLYDRTLTVNGVSKSHSMTGWRIGYGAGPVELMDAIGSLQSHSTSNACSISQYAALAALTGDQTILKKGKDLFESRRNLVMEKLSKISKLKIMKPIGAFYFFINCEKVLNKKTPEGDIIKSSMDFSSYLLKKALVAVVPGEAFGLENHFRISYATSEENLVKSCDRISKACDDLTE